MGTKGINFGLILIQFNIIFNTKNACQCVKNTHIYESTVHNVVMNMQRAVTCMTQYDV